MSIQNLNLPAKRDESDAKIDYRRRLADLVTKNVADTLLLMIKTQGVHWNIVGPHFLPVHTLTEEHYRDLFEAADTLAERIRALGYRAPANIGHMREISTVSETAGDQTAEEMIKELESDHEAVAKRMRGVVKIAESLDDTVTADLLTARIEFHEKAVWMLRSILGR
jgi:starvation-inducible DNA-binding protein